MKIYVNATFLSSEFLTGIARFAITLSRGLKEKMGDDIIFLCPPSIQHPEIASELGAVTIGFNNYRVLWEQLDLPYYLRKQGNPLLISFSNTAPLFYSNQIVSILDLFHQKIDSLLVENKGVYSWATTFYFQKTVPYLIKRAKKILTISEYSKKDIIETFKCDPNHIFVVYPSLSTVFQQPSPVSTSNKYGKYILGVSAVTPRKNFDGLIRAYKKAALNDTKLVITGGFEASTKNYGIRELCANDDNIVFTGHVSDHELISLYKNALFFAFPSFMEGFGIPPLEAMACGCPCLVSNVTSLPEVCGDASLYVDPYNIDSICEGMKKLHGDELLRDELILKGFERLAVFSRELSIQNLMSHIGQ